MPKVGRPPHEPTDKDRRMVQSLCAYGIPEEDIAKVIGITGKTLRKHYRHELDISLPMANAEAAECIQMFIKRKIGGPKQWLTAAIFRAKTQGKWREVQRHEHGGTDGTDTIKSRVQFVIAADEQDA